MPTNPAPLACIEIHKQEQLYYIASIGIGTSHENTIANAKLIASAPELLEALQAVSRLDYLQEHNALADKVRAAISKATGQAL